MNTIFMMHTQSAIHLRIQEFKRKEDTPPKNQTETMEIIAKIICDRYSFTLSQLKQKRRFRTAVKARQLCMYFMVERKITLKAIGAFMGGFDHTTVIHSKDTVNDLKDSDTDYKNEFEYLQSLIKKQLL